MSALTAGACAAGAGLGGAAAGAGLSALAGAAGAGFASAAPSSSVASSAPSLTFSPTLTLTSPITPAAGDGTSSVALSDSSVTITSSLAAFWPGFTWISIIGTSLKSPMSGSLISRAMEVVLWTLRRHGRACPGHPRHDEAHGGVDVRHKAGYDAEETIASQQDAAHVLDHAGELAHEARRRRAVDHPMIVGEAERQHEPRDKGLAVPDRRHFRAHDAENGDFRRIDDWRECRAADAAEGGDREGRALHLGGRELAIAGLGRYRSKLAGKLDHALAIDVLDYRHDQAVGRIDRNADMPIIAHHQRVLSRRQRGVEGRIGLQGGDRSLHQERQQRDTVRRLLVGLALVVEALAEAFKVGDVGFVAMGDVRNVDPRGMQARPGNAFDAGK